MSSPSITIIGLGYVGLPLALALARHFPVTGYDSSKTRIAELKDGVDATGEVAASALTASTLALSNDAGAIDGARYFIITVPTPVDAGNRPDLSHVLAA